MKLINAEINICDIRSRVKHESNGKVTSSVGKKMSGGKAGASSAGAAAVRKSATRGAGVAGGAVRGAAAKAATAAPAAAPQDVAARRPGRPSGAARGAQQRDRLLDAALELFARQGIVDTTLGEMAREAGFTPAMMHYYREDA